MAVVRMLVGLAGLGFARASGDLHECDEGTARRLIAAGCAEPVAPAVPVAPPVIAAAPETAMRAPAPERAIKPRGKAR